LLKLPCATHLLPSHPEAVTVVSSPECLGLLAQKMIDASGVEGLFVISSDLLHVT